MLSLLLFIIKVLVSLLRIAKDENAELKEMVMLANINMFKVYSFVTTVNQKLASANGGRIINL